MDQFIGLIQVVIALFLCLTILMQHRASGLSATFGGGGASNVVQRRGAEKLIFKLSIWLSVAFFALTVLRWFL